MTGVPAAQPEAEAEYLRRFPDRVVPDARRVRAGHDG
jgi:hypothetical protein